MYVPSNAYYAAYNTTILERELLERALEMERALERALTRESSKEREL